MKKKYFWRRKYAKREKQQLVIEKRRRWDKRIKVITLREEGLSH